MAEINKNFEAKVGSSKSGKRKNKQRKVASNHKDKKSNQSSKHINNDKPSDSHAKAENPGHESDYEIVSPPPMKESDDSFNWLVLLKGLGVVLIIMVATGFIWSSFSDYIAPYMSVFRFDPASDRTFNHLTDRVIALEKRLEVTSAEKKSIKEMEKERSSLQSGVKEIFAQLKRLEVDLDNVKELSGKVGVSVDREDAKAFFDDFTDRLSQLEKYDATVEDLVERLERLESSGSKNIAKNIQLTEEKNLLLRSEINKMQERLDQVELEKSKRRERSQTRMSEKRISDIVDIVSKLRKSVIIGVPYQKQLKVLRGLLKGEDGITTPLLELEKHSTKGVMASHALLEKFLELSGKVVLSSRGEQINSYLPQKIINQLSSLISFRRMDGKAEHSAIDSHLFKIEKSLKNIRLEDAHQFATELINKFPSTKDLMTPWISVVNTRLLADRAIASLHVYVITLIAQGGK